jgi:peptidoglycan hydrolase-like protein with peptidoglycan-binding domain
MNSKSQTIASTPWIRELQQLLNERLQPNPALRIDGYYGPQTREAARHFISLGYNASYQSTRPEAV